MTTALIVYGLTAADVTTLTTANQLVAAAGGTVAAGHSCKVGTSTGYGELFAQGFTTAWPALGSIGVASGHGAIWDVTTLEGQDIIAGNWTAEVRLTLSVGTATADIIVRAFKRSSAGVYTQIGSDMTLAAQSLTITPTAYTFAAVSQPTMSFATGDKLYLDVWLNITTNGTGSSTATCSLSMSSNATLGTINTSLTTPGYQPTPVALSGTLAGVGTLAGPLSAALSLPNTTLAGVGTLAGTTQLTVALAVTEAGVGTLAATWTLATALSDTLAGIGTLTGTLSIPGGGVSLTGTLAGAGTLSGVFSMRIALFLTCAGIGTLIPTLTIPGAPAPFLSAIWVTRDLAGTWQTRDLAGTWKMRDEQGVWDSRDAQGTWDSRDDQATWKTR